MPGEELSTLFNETASASTPLVPAAAAKSDARQPDVVWQGADWGEGAPANDGEHICGGKVVETVYKSLRADNGVGTVFHVEKSSSAAANRFTIAELVRIEFTKELGIDSKQISSADSTYSFTQYEPTTDTTVEGGATGRPIPESSAVRAQPDHGALAESNEADDHVDVERPHPISYREFPFPSRLLLPDAQPARCRRSPLRRSSRDSRLPLRRRRGKLSFESWPKSHAKERAARLYLQNIVGGSVKFPGLDRSSGLNAEHIEPTRPSGHIG